VSVVVKNFYKNSEVNIHKAVKRVALIYETVKKCIIKSHNISFEEAKTVFYDPDHSEGEDRFIRWRFNTQEPAHAGEPLGRFNSLSMMAG
jgi:hypothetical protein